MEDKFKIEKIKSMRAAFFHSLSDTPEEDAWKKAQEWGKKKGILRKDSKTRIFGRNIYPTENPEPHGYGYYLTITPDIEVEPDILVRIIPGGQYVVARAEGFEQIGVIWGELWKLVGEGKYKYIGEIRGEFGFELGFEEHVNWYTAFVETSDDKFIFNLMLQLWEE